MSLDTVLDLLQWPAMVSSIAAAWLVASKKPERRQLGFWVFLGSNVLWIIWGWKDGAWALVSLQVVLAALNIRGVKKTDDEVESDGEGSKAAYSKAG